VMSSFGDPSPFTERIRSAGTALIIQVTDMDMGKAATAGLAHTAEGGRRLRPDTHQRAPAPLPPGHRTLRPRTADPPDLSHPGRARRGPRQDRLEPQKDTAPSPATRSGVRHQGRPDPDHRQPARPKHGTCRTCRTNGLPTPFRLLPRIRLQHFPPSTASVRCRPTKGTQGWE
jgi:hypothetical protein